MWRNCLPKVFPWRESEKANRRIPFSKKVTTEPGPYCWISMGKIWRLLRHTANKYLTCLSYLTRMHTEFMNFPTNWLSQCSLCRQWENRNKLVAMSHIFGQVIREDFLQTNPHRGKTGPLTSWQKCCAFGSKEIESVDKIIEISKRTEASMMTERETYPIPGKQQATKEWITHAILRVLRRNRASVL